MLGFMKFNEKGYILNSSLTLDQVLAIKDLFENPPFGDNSMSSKPLSSVLLRYLRYHTQDGQNY